MKMARKHAAKMTHKQGIDRLDMSIKLFAKGNYVSCVKEIKLIKKELNSTKNFPILNSTYKVLQTRFIVEFNHMVNKHKNYRIQLSTFFKRKVNLTTKLNISGLNNKTTDRQWGKLIKQRLEARIILQKLEGLLDFRQS